MHIDLYDIANDVDDVELWHEVNSRHRFLHTISQDVPIRQMEQERDRVKGKGETESALRTSVPSINFTVYPESF